MKIELKKEFEYDGDVYIALCSITEFDTTYYFGNKINMDEPTEEYGIFTCNNDSIDIVTDRSLLEHLLPMFQAMVGELIKKEGLNE